MQALTKLNLQKQSVKEIVLGCAIVAIILFVLLFPVSLYLFIDSVKKTQNNAHSSTSKELILLPICIILIAYTLGKLCLWIFRYLRFKNVASPAEESISLYCKKVVLIKLFSQTVVKIKTKQKSFFYVVPTNIKNISFEELRKRCQAQSALLKCYQGTTFIKSM